jgi:hypothetical protein
MQKLCTYLSIVFLMSCTSVNSKPNDELAFTKVKEKKFNALRSDDFFEVIEFAKINGEDLNIFGQDVYRFHYRLKVKFKINAHTLFREDLQYLLTDKELKEEAKGRKFTFDFNNYYHYKIGDTKIINGKVEFRKTEIGWK